MTVLRQPGSLITFIEQPEVFSICMIWGCAGR
jgi:hypothetical protein